MNIVDRRANPTGKSLPNRERFLRRYRDAIREAVSGRIREGKIEDVGTDDKKKVRISGKTTHEPIFRHGPGGTIERVIPGNRKFLPGDLIPKPEGGGRGNEGSPDGEGEDDFEFYVSSKEFLDFFFEGLELPNMVKRTLRGDEEFRWQRAGFSSDGPPNKMDPVRTLRQAQARRYAFRTSKERRKKQLEDERERLTALLLEADTEDKEGVAKILEAINAINAELVTVESQIGRIHFIDPFDVRYRLHEKVPLPIKQAVMFLLLDVSGSMGEWEKEMAKRFFLLLYLFLIRQYKRVDIVFIRHTQTAKEVNEEDFFYSKESGGTVISSAVQLMKDIIDARYPIDRWNIYVSEATDGDNYADDAQKAHDIVFSVMPLVQYYAYVEVRNQQIGDWSSVMWPLFAEVAKQEKYFAMAKIKSPADIYPVFRNLFKKEGMQ